MDERDDHYGAENTVDGVHSCSQTECMTRDVPEADLHQIGYSLGILAPALDGTGIKTTVFRDGTGLYVLLTTPVDDADGASRAVIGAIYTPTLLAALRASGYTTSYDEWRGGVN